MYSLCSVGILTSNIDNDNNKNNEDNNEDKDNEDSNEEDNNKGIHIVFYRGGDRGQEKLD